MKFSINREQLLKPLQQVAAVVEKRQTLPVLSNVLLEVGDGQLSMTGTDLELELVARLPLEGEMQPGETTVPARKLVDIAKSLPAEADIRFEVDGERMLVRSGRSRFHPLYAAGVRVSQPGRRCCRLQSGYPAQCAARPD